MGRTRAEISGLMSSIGDQHDEDVVTLHTHLL